MDLFNSYLDKQILLNSMASKFANSNAEVNQFVGNPKRDDRPMMNAKTTGLPTGNGLGSQTGTGLEDKQFKSRKPAIKDGIASEEKKAVPEEAGAGGSSSEGIVASGNASSSSSSPPPNSEEEAKHDGAGNAGSTAPQPMDVDAGSGFDKHISGFGVPFKNSRSRKSLVFVPQEREKPLRGWKSLRNAGLSSKKVGKIGKNGHNIFHTTKDGSDGRMYFLNKQAWDALRRKKKVLLEE